MLAAVWATAVELSGGFSAKLGPLQLSSRNPVPAISIALMAGLAACVLLFVPAARSTTQEDVTWYRHHVGRLSPASVTPALLSLASLVGLVACLDVLQWLRGAPLWVDEEMIAINIRDRSFAELTGTLWLGQSAPLGWLAVQRTVLLLFGAGELVLRFVPLLFGIATLAAAAWIGWRWLTAPAAAFLVVIGWVSEWLSHFRFELKHYSADVFWALLLPALAVWAAEEAGPRAARFRWIVWWTTAAVAQLLANGALLVTPGCAIVLAVLMLRRSGFGAVLRFAAAGGIWLATFGVHYLLSLQFTHHNRYLRNYWVGEFPTHDAGVLGTVTWIGERLVPLAENPGASTLGAALWLAALLGMLVSRHRVLSAMFAAAPLTAFVLAALRIVPLYERFSVWIVPALYLGLTLLFDSGARALVEGWRFRRAGRGVLGTLALATAVAIGADICRTGWPALDFGQSPNSNHGVDDRRAVPWLMARRQSGDAVLSTRLGWPAIWWYGRISLKTVGMRGRLPDGSVMYQVSHQRPGPACADWSDLFAQHERVLVHVAFPDMPEGFYELLLRELAPFAAIVDAHVFADRSRVAVLQRRSKGGGAPPGPTDASDVPLEGCVGVATVRRW